MTTEAMPGLQHVPDRFVALPFRRGEKDVPNWTRCLDYISAYHASNLNSSVEAAVTSMREMHNTIVKVCDQNDTKSLPTESFIASVLRRYCELVAMAQAHLPLNGGVVHKNMEYMWRDSFDGGKYVTSNSNLELVSCVYNLAASYAYVAVQQAQHGTAEELRGAYNNFLHAAGYYVMTEALLSRLPSELVVRGDFKQDSLTMLTALCVAQAHHCGYLRFEADASKAHAVRAKIAAEAARQYDAVLVKLKSSSWYTAGKSSNGAKEAALQIAGAAHVLWTRAHVHVAAGHLAEQDNGTAIAHYLRAKEYLANMPKMPTQALIAWVNSVVASVNDAHRRAQDANTSIFFSRVPTSVPTPEGLPRPLGQPTEHASLVAFTSSRSTDPFFGIVPAHIANTVRAWRERQRKLVDVCTHAAEASKSTVQRRLQELGVPAAVAGMSGEVQSRGRVPEPLRSRVLALQRDAAACNTDTNSMLVQQMNGCQQLQQLIVGKMAEIEAELAKEQAADQEFVKAYGEKMWRAACPAPSTTLDYGTITATLAKHRAEMSQHLTAPLAALKRRCDEHVRDLGRLSWSMTDLDALMPFTETQAAQQQAAAVLQLVQQLAALLATQRSVDAQQQERLTALREVLESDRVAFDLSAAAAGEQERLLTAASKRVADAMEEVGALTRARDELVGKAAALLEQLGVLQSADPVGSEAAEVVNRLHVACETYTAVVEQCKDVAQYAQGVLDSLEATHSTALSFTMSRKLHAADVAQAIDQQIAVKMNEMQHARNAVASSQQRQEELRTELALLEQRRASASHMSVSAHPLPPPPPPQQQPQPPPEQWQQQQPPYAPPPPQAAYDHATTMAPPYYMVAQTPPQQQQQQQPSYPPMQQQQQQPQQQPSYPPMQQPQPSYPPPPLQQQQQQQQQTPYPAYPHPPAAAVNASPSLYQPPTF